MKEYISSFTVVLLFVAGCSQQPPRPAPVVAPAKPVAPVEPRPVPPKPETPPVAPSAPVANPTPSAPDATAAQDQVAAKVQELGGTVSRNNTDGNPIYGVRVTGRKPDVAALVAAIKSLDQLQELSLDRAELTDADLQPLGELTRLTVLDLSGNELTDAGLVHLKPLAKLEQLRISQNGITDLGLMAIGEFKNLKKLFLGRNPITDNGLAALTGLSNLEELNVGGCSDLTDAALMHIAKLPKLKEVWVQFTRIKDPAVEAFKQQRPGVTVEK